MKGGMRFSLNQLPARHRAQAAAQLEGRLSPPAAPRHANKYGAKPVEAAGEKFASRHEFRQYQLLRLRELAGEIQGLRRQVKFSLFDAGGHCRGEHIGTYTADFVYRELDELVVADAKSEKTRRLREWPRTKALMRACHGIEVREL